MRPILRADGTLLVPMRATGPGALVGDGMVPLGPKEPGYAIALAKAIPEGVDPIVAELSRPPAPPRTGWTGDLGRRRGVDPGRRGLGGGAPWWRTERPERPAA